MFTFFELKGEIINLSQLVYADVNDQTAVIFHYSNGTTRPLDKEESAAFIALYVALKNQAQPKRIQSPTP